MRCGTHNLFGLVGDILSQVGQPSFISIAGNEFVAVKLLDIGIHDTVSQYQILIELNVVIYFLME